MRLTLAMLFLMLASCTPTLRAPLIKAEGEGWAIRQDDATHFVIWAPSLSAAQSLANQQLDCRKRLCLLTPAGQVIAVERP